MPRSSSHIGSMLSWGLAFQSDAARQILPVQLHSIRKLYDLNLVFAYSNKLHYSDSDNKFSSVDSSFLSGAWGIINCHDTGLRARPPSRPTGHIESASNLRDGQTHHTNNLTRTLAESNAKKEEFSERTRSKRDLFV